MEPELLQMKERFDRLYAEMTGVLNDLVVLRRQSPRMKAETARMLEGYLIEVSRTVKEISKNNHDDLMEGISLLKIKMMS